MPWWRFCELIDQLSCRMRWHYLRPKWLPKAIISDTASDDRKGFVGRTACVTGSIWGGVYDPSIKHTTSIIDADATVKMNEDSSKITPVSEAIPKAMMDSKQTQTEDKVTT